MVAWQVAIPHSHYSVAGYSDFGANLFYLNMVFHFSGIFLICSVHMVEFSPFPNFFNCFFFGDVEIWR